MGTMFTHYTTGNLIRTTGRFSLFERDGWFAVLGSVRDGSPVLYETTDRAQAVARYEQENRQDMERVAARYATTEGG